MRDGERLRDEEKDGDEPKERPQGGGRGREGGIEMERLKVRGGVLRRGRKRLPGGSKEREKRFTEID